MNLDPNVDLDLWRPIYKPGDKVWILCPKGIFEGQVLSRYASTEGRSHPDRNASKKVYPMYYVYTRDALKIHGVARRKYAVYVRGGQLVPRLEWELRPLQRLEMLLEMEVNSARVRHLIEQFKARGIGEAPRGGDAP